jgi:hypothetical protein
MDWQQDWEAFIAMKQQELNGLNAWIAEKMPQKKSGQKVYGVIGADPLLQGLIAQRGSLSREIAEARKYITRKDVAA